MKVDIKQSFNNLIDIMRTKFVRQTNNCEMPMPLNIVSQATPVQVIEACMIFLDKHADKLSFIADTSMICGNDDVTVAVVYNKENSKYNQRSLKRINRYYFKLTEYIEDLGNDYCLEFISGEKFDFSKKDTKSEEYQKIGQLFKSLYERYKAEESIKKANQAKQIMNCMLNGVKEK
ncbi:MAG: hypothetical protein IKB59_03825 [Alphaproteobacteria bacterium]|nr:hypothetical protein [Alphaproteobacteria bacterium]